MKSKLVLAAVAAISILAQAGFAVVEAKLGKELEPKVDKVMDYGTLKSKTLVQSKSALADMNGLFVYDAVFSKKTGTLAVNFMKEGGAWKVQQVQVNP